METIMHPGKDRVREVTSEDINREIDYKTAESVRYYSSQSAQSIKSRVSKIEREWDVERTLELNASILALFGIVMAARVNKKWLILPTVITTFLAQHAIQGWCPPLPLFRRLGIRTQKEIETERYALIELLEGKTVIV